TGPFGTSTRTRVNYIVARFQLVITSIQVSGTNVLVSFTSEAGKYYRLEYSDALSSPTWRTAVDVIPGSGNIVTATHVGGALQPARFYRVKLLTSSDLVPAASFNAAPMFGLAPLLVTFNDTSTGYITNRSWHFGDGSSTNTSAVTVSHLYANPGTNSVTLVVSGPFGTSTRTRPDYIIVTSTLSITDILLSGPDVLVSFTSQAGRSYRL